jgi:SM-20-related protein
MEALQVLNDRHDIVDLHARFAAAGHLRIDSWLGEQAVEALRVELLNAPEWRRVIHTPAKVYECSRADFENLDHAAKGRITQSVRDAARAGFQFQYDTIREDGPLDGLPLFAEFIEAMNAPETKGRLQEICGVDSIDLIDAQATAYHPGDFLTRHDDHVVGKERRAAYVLGLSKGWNADWGGQLMHHVTADCSIAMTPSFNSLDLLRVPSPHSVAMVTPFAGGIRLSVTGWLRGNHTASSL